MIDEQKERWSDKKSLFLLFYFWVWKYMRSSDISRSSCSREGDIGTHMTEAHFGERVASFGTHVHEEQLPKVFVDFNGVLKLLMDALLLLTSSGDL